MPMQIGRETSEKSVVNKIGGGGKREKMGSENNLLTAYPWDLRKPELDWNRESWSQGFDHGVGHPLSASVPCKSI